MTGSFDHENKRHYKRRESDKIVHSEMHIDMQQCPMTPDSVDEMLITVKEVLVRVENIEKSMFAGRVAFRTAVVIGTSAFLLFSWFRDNLSAIRDVLNNK
mgnify:CR=1 FL=1